MDFIRTDRAVMIPPDDAVITLTTELVSHRDSAGFLVPSLTHLLTNQIVDDQLQ